MSTPHITEETTRFARLASLPEGVGLENTDLRRLRINLLAEEFHEYLEGEGAEVEHRPGDGKVTDVWLHGEPDLVEIADGLADVIVIAWGTLLTYVGAQCARDVAREVWESNLSKVDGSLGPIVRREDGKLLKPEGWTPPDVEGVLRRHGWLPKIECDDNQPLIGGGPCNGDHRDNLHHNDAGFFWGMS